MYLDFTDIQLFITVPGQTRRKLLAITDGEVGMQWDTRETTRFATGVGRNYVHSTLAFNVSASVVAKKEVHPDKIDFKELMKLFLGKQVVEVEMVMIEEAGVIQLGLEGTAIITSCQASGSTGNNLTASITLQGNGVPIILEP